MQITSLSIPGLFLIEPARFEDGRGFFSETFRLDFFQKAVGGVEFVQDNHSLSAEKGTIRGLHYQKEPHAQGKLIRVVRGSILDVAVDVRRGSPTYGRYEAVELSADNWRQLWVPMGFLHGFCTLVDDVEVIYKVTDYYSREHDAGVCWNDPDLGIAWPFREVEVHLSDRDTVAPSFRDVDFSFVYSN